jgi:hypothetical protein
MNGGGKPLLAWLIGGHSSWELNHPHYPLVIAGVAIALIIILYLTGYKD